MTFVIGILFLALVASTYTTWSEHYYSKDKRKRKAKESDLHLT